MRGKNIQEKEDMEETHNFDKRSINEVLTSTLHIVTLEAPQTEYLSDDMNILFERALEIKQVKWEDIGEIRKNTSISLPTN